MYLTSTVIAVHSKVYKVYKKEGFGFSLYQIKPRTTLFYSI